MRRTRRSQDAWPCAGGVGSEAGGRATAGIAVRREDGEKGQIGTPGNAGIAKAEGSWGEGDRKRRKWPADAWMGGGGVG